MQGETQKRIQDFYEFITNYPLLALHHEAGRALEKEIASFPRTNVNDEIWYRAKSPDGTRILLKDDMLPPLPEDTREGRYNHYGLPSLYVSENEYTCACEIRHDGEENILCWIQKIKIHNASVIDLTDAKYFKNNSERHSSNENAESPLLIEGLILTQTIITHPSEKRRYYKPEYKITRFIADLCRLYKIDGIKYPSAVSRTKDNGHYKNIVLFDTEQKLFSLEGDPYVFKSGI